MPYFTSVPKSKFSVRAILQVTGMVLGSVLPSQPLTALPIGFGINQGELEYSEISSEHFIVYHDRRVPGEGAMMMTALEAARPTMEAWFQTQRQSQLPVIMSAVTSNASFANFLTDAIELQTLGQGSRDLAWHEYVHSTMYRTMDNILGPAGAIIYLPWMPAWYIEGLAEALSVSVGSTQMAGIERYQALNNDWPTFDRLHSLYAKFDFSERGYATAGAFVQYILQQGNASELATLQKDFFRYAQPWWWPWAIVPFNDFMPMDAALANFVGSQGEELYEKYKKAATAYWQKHAQGPHLLKEPGQRYKFTSLSGLRSQGEELTHLTRLDDEQWETTVDFDKKTGWAVGVNKHQLAEFQSFARVHNKTLRAGVAYEVQANGEETSRLIIKNKESSRSLEQRPSTIMSLAEGPKHLFFTEYSGQTSRLCYVDKEASPPVATCPLIFAQPRRLRPIGERPSTVPGISREIWLDIEEETLLGNRHTILTFDTKSLKVTKALPMQAEPVTVTFTDKSIWMLTGERQARTLRRLDEAGRCQGVALFKDHLTNIKGLSSGELIAGIYAGGGAHYLRKLQPGELIEKPCYEPDAHISPLLVAMRSKDKIDLASALKSATLWTEAPAPLTPSEAQALEKAPPLDKAHSGTDTWQRSAKANWRGRHAFTFPWIGAEDALGPQLGIVSVPLMDHLQNETLRLTLLYGVQSRFPYQEIALTTNRFTPTVTLTAYRQQTYNGRSRKPDSNELVNSYLDEKGGRLESTLSVYTFNGSGTLTLGTGIKYAHLKPYLGSTNVRRGFLTEPAASINLTHKHGLVSFSHLLSGRIAPASLNEEFDYNQIGVSSQLTLKLPFWQSRAQTGLELSRTRGQKRRELMEVYRPLKTFVPGSGGGYNQNNFSLTTSEGLFEPVFGDTQGRVRTNWTAPLIPDFDKLLWILYLERLDFTAFYNYGAAWRGDKPQMGWDKLIRAHGYNVDLQLENKGVRFNVGCGTGQVVGKPFEVYLTTGFDALF